MGSFEPEGTDAGPAAVQGLLASASLPVPAHPLQRLEVDQQGLKQALLQRVDRAYEGVGGVVEEPRSAPAHDEGFLPDQALLPEDLEPLQHRGTGEPPPPNQPTQGLRGRPPLSTQGGADPPPKISPRHDPIRQLKTNKIY